MPDRDPPPHDVPDYYQLDLNPDLYRDRHAGDVGLTAYEIKELHRQLRDFAHDDLKRIAIAPEGTRLEPGATYFDLMHPEAGPFTASGELTADSDHYYVPKSQTDYLMWNRLIGVTNPARLDQADDQAGEP